MKKTGWILLGISSLLLLGGCQSFRNSAYEEKSYEGTKGLKELELTDSNTPVKIVGVKENKPLTITYFENKNATYSIDEKSDTLVVKKKDSKFGWNFFSFFQWNDKNTGVLIEVPQNQLEEMDIQTSNSRLSVENIKLKEGTFKTSNGRLILEEVDGAELEGKTSNAKLDLTDVTVRSGEFKTSNGAVTVDGLSIKKEMSIKTSNGSVKGIINGNREEFKIKSSTSNSKNNLKEKDSGSKKLSIKTSNGDIRVSFEKE